MFKKKGFMFHVLQNNNIQLNHDFHILKKKYRFFLLLLFKRYLRCKFIRGSVIKYLRSNIISFKCMQTTWGSPGCLCVSRGNMIPVLENLFIENIMSLWHYVVSFGWLAQGEESMQRIHNINVLKTSNLLFLGFTVKWRQYSWDKCRKWKANSCLSGKCLLSTFVSIILEFTEFMLAGMIPKTRNLPHVIKPCKFFSGLRVRWLL